MLPRTRRAWHLADKGFQVSRAVERFGLVSSAVTIILALGFGFQSGLDLRQGLTSLSGSFDFFLKAVLVSLWLIECSPKPKLPGNPPSPERLCKHGSSLGGGGAAGQDSTALEANATNRTVEFLETHLARMMPGTLKNHLLTTALASASAPCDE